MSVLLQIKSGLQRTGPGRSSVYSAPFVSSGSRTGTHVDEANALTFDGFFSAVAYLANVVAQLPWDIIRRTGGRRENLDDHPLVPPLNMRPNPYTTAIAFWSTLVQHAVSWGNGYAEIVTNKPRTKFELWNLTPDRVEPMILNSGELVYLIDGERAVPASKIFHLAGLGWDGLKGYSVVRLAAGSIGQGIAQDKYAGAFYKHAVRPSSAISLTGKLGDKAHDRFKKQIKEFHEGADHAHRVLVLEEGATITKLAVPPEEAQLLESRKLQIVVMARWLRIPPHKLYDLQQATFSNIEHQNLEVWQDTLLPWILRCEQETWFKLLSENEPRLRAKMNASAILRADTKTQAEADKIAREGGWLSGNEIRVHRDMNPIGPAGDIYLVPANMRDAEALLKERELDEEEPEPVAEEPPEDEESPGDGDPGEGEEGEEGEDVDEGAARARSAQVRMFRDVLSTACRRAVHWFERAHRKGDPQALKPAFDEFAAQQAEHVAGRILPVMRALVDLSGDDSTRLGESLSAVATTFAERFVRSHGSVIVVQDGAFETTPEAFGAAMDEASESGAQEIAEMTAGLIAPRVALQDAGG